MQFVFFNEKLMLMNLVQAAVGQVTFLPVRSQEEVYTLTVRFRTKAGDYRAEFTLDTYGYPVTVNLERIEQGVLIASEEETVRLQALIQKEMQKYS